MDKRIFIVHSSEDVMLPDDAVLEDYQLCENENIIGKLVEALGYSPEYQDSIKFDWTEDNCWYVIESIKLAAQKRFNIFFEDTNANALRMRNLKGIAHYGDSIYVLNKEDLQSGEFNFDIYFVTNRRELTFH